MAMAAALVANTPTASFERSALHQEALSGPKHAVVSAHHHRRSSWDYFSPSRGPSSEPSAASGLSSSGRDGGACCSSIVACSVSTSHRNNNAADHLRWRACLGGLRALDVTGFSFAAAGPAAATRKTNSVPRRLPLRISAEKPDLTNVAGTLLRLGKQGVVTGMKLVPESVPRPVAQAGVGLAGVLLASFLLKSLFSTVTFILAIGALSYAGYFFLTRGESSNSSGKGEDGPSGKPKSSDEALEEARRIMEKYK